MRTATKKRTVADRIKHLKPCSEAMEWAAGYTSPAKAWAECERGDWMLWLTGSLSGKPGSEARKTLVLCACECARLALPYVTAGEKRPLAAIETAERWARDEAGVTLAAADYADCAAAHCAAAHCAAHCADYAAAQCAANAYSANAVLKDCADIVRKHYPRPPKITRAK